MKRVLVTGSRDLLDWSVVYKVLNDIKAKLGRFQLVVGDCPTGADKFAREWASKQGWQPEVHEADWDTHGKAAGPLRNRQMARSKVNYCLGFPHPVKPSVGTIGCMTEAKKAKVTTYRIDSEGRATLF